MNDEILIRFGGDVGAFNRALRTMESGAQSFGARVTSSFKDMAAKWGAALSVGAAVAGIKKVLHDFEALSTEAENLSVSTDFLQGIRFIASKDVVGGAEAMAKGLSQLNVNLGQLRGGVTDGVEKFKRWGITMADIAGMNSEEVLYLIAERMKELPDPTQRAAMAMELLGKSGKGAVGLLGKGADEVKRLVDEVNKVDEAQIQRLAAAQHQLQNLGQTLMTLAGEGVGNLIAAFEALGDAFGRGDYAPGFGARALARLDADKQSAIDAANAEKKRSQAAADAAEMEERAQKARERYNKAVEASKFKNADAAGKVAMLQAQWAKLRLELEDAQGTEKQLEIQEKMLEVEDRLADAKREVANEEKKAAREQLSIEREKLHVIERQIKAAKDAKRQRDDFGKLSLGELAERGNRRAQSAMDIKAQIEDAYARGDERTAADLKERYRQTVGGIVGLTSGDANPFEQDPYDAALQRARDRMANAGRSGRALEYRQSANDYSALVQQGREAFNRTELSKAEKQAEATRKAMDGLNKVLTPDGLRVVPGDE